MNKYYGLIVSLIAGLSTIIGYFAIYIKGSKDKIISKLLFFTSGVMMTLSIIDLLPTAFKSMNGYNSVVSFIICILFFFIGFYLTHLLRKKYNSDNSLYKTGIMSMIAIMLHNIPEGIATYIFSSIDLKLGIVFSLAIIFHNIPEGITISIPIYYSTKSKFKTLIYTFISGISEFVGALITMIFLYKYINNTLIGILFSIIAGIMIYLSFELIEISKDYSASPSKYYFFVGSIFILFVEILLKL